MGTRTFLCLAAGLCASLPAFAAASDVTVSGASGLTITVSTDGAWNISLTSPAWRFGGNVGVPLSHLRSGQGSDPAGGAYAEISFDFTTDAARSASIRSYFGSRAVVFTASVPNGGPNTFQFPTLSRYPKGLSHIAFSGLFGFPTFYGSNPDSPWVYFDSAMNSVILSPASHFMVASTGLSPDGSVTTGISNKIATLPPGFTHETLLVIENGVNRAFDSWGTMLTNITGKIRPPNDFDVTLNKLGYWTDAGATYYYAMEPRMSYPETLLALKEDFARQKVPLGYVQLDSWFYPKGASADWRAREDGIFEYLAASPPFASSLATFQRSLGLPLMAHSRWIDAQSPYRKQYRMSGDVSIDPLYWGEVARYLSASGVTAFEQDWLADRATTEFNLTDGDAFLDNMAAAMARENLTMQYCSGTARHFLQSARYSNLTTIRVSEDRFERTRWSNFLYASRLASAVGAWPFTDVLMSSETDNLILATLSAGPVGVGDRLRALDGANLRRVARADGVIVKPDVPLAPIDLSFANDSRNLRAPMIASTYSDIAGSRAWYLFIYPQSDNTRAVFRLADAGPSGPLYLYDYLQGTGRVVDSAEVLQQEVPNYSYQIAVPLGSSGMALVGDTGQFVTLGKKRIATLWDDGSIHMTVSFAAGESSRTLVGYSPDLPSVAPIEGVVSAFSYDAGTHQFAVTLAPAGQGTASVMISRPGNAVLVPPFRIRR